MSQAGKRFYEFGPFRLDLQERVLLRGGEEAPLTPKVFDVLLALVENRGRTLDKDELLRQVWPDTFIEEGNLARNISRLRVVLGEGPKDQRYIRTVARRGYRFVAEVTERLEGDVGSGDPPAPVGPQPESEAAATATVPRQTSSRLRKLLKPVALALGLAALVVVADQARRRLDRVPAPGRVTAIAVLPFKAIGVSPADEYLGLGLTDALITRLANIRQLVVRPTSAVRRYAEASPDPVAAGQALGVDAVLEGSVRRFGERIRVTAQLVRVKDGRHLWALQLDEAATDLFALEDSIARRLAEKLALTLGAEEKRRLSSRYTNSPEAYQAYLRGRYLASKLTIEGFRQGIAYLNEAVGLDPDFALAHDGLANYHINTADILAPPREAFPRARAAAERALALDDSLGEAHASLANVHWQYEWDWAGAEREFRRSLDLNPNLAVARSYHAFFLGLMGRSDEGIAEGLRAQELDPLTPEVSVIAGLGYYYARRYDRAAVHLRRIADLETGSWLAQVALGRAYERQGAMPEALAAYERARRIDPDVTEVLMDLGRGYAVAGRRSDAERTLEDLRALSANGYAAPFQIAMVYVGLGDRDRAFAWLEKAYEARSWYLTWLKVEPALDPLRQDPRYADLMRRVGFVR